MTERQSGSDPIGELQRWLIRSGARSVTRQLGDQVRTALAAGNTHGDVWENATADHEAPECQWCPICRARRRLRESGPGLSSSVAAAGDAVSVVLQDAAAAFEAAVAAAARQARPRDEAPASGDGVGRGRPRRRQRRGLGRGHRAAGPTPAAGWRGASRQPRPRPRGSGRARASRLPGRPGPAAERRARAGPAAGPATPARPGAAARRETAELPRGGAGTVPHVAS